MANEEENKIEIELEEIDISDIYYLDKSIDEWEDYLTIKIPSLPCTSHQITTCIIDLCNRYQDAYNAYNKLIVLCSKSEKSYSIERDSLISDKISDVKGRIPAKDTLESVVLSSSKKLQLLRKRNELYNAIKDFFENNKTKLEKSMLLARDISYHVNLSDKMNNKGSVGNGYH